MAKSGKVTKPLSKSGKSAKAGKSSARVEADFPLSGAGWRRDSLWRAATNPLPIIPRRWRGEWRHMAAVFALAFLLYAITAPRVVTLEDDGIFIGNLATFGVAHPPGYPLHTLLGGVFYHLIAFLPPAYKAHLFSGFAAAAACVCLYAIAVQLWRPRVYGYLAAGVYATSKMFWSQAIIAEVYTLNAFMFFCLLALTIRYAGSVKHDWRLLMIMGVVCGLGLANHYPLLALGGIGLAMLVAYRLRGNFLHFIGAAVAAAATTAPLYLWMVWRSHSDTLFNFYGPMESLDQFLFYVLRRGYGEIDTQADTDFTDKIAHLLYLSDSVLWQFTPIGFVFAALGLIALLRSRYNFLSIALFVSFFMSSYFLITMISFRSETLAFAVFSVYPLVAYGVMALWLAAGVAWVFSHIQPRIPRARRTMIKSGVVVLLIAANIAAHGGVNNRSDYRWAHDFATLKLEDIKDENAILFTYDDLDIPLGYLHFVEGVRPDITLYHDAGLMYPNRLFHPLLPETPPPEHPNGPNRAAIIQQFAAQQTRPIYFHSVRQGYFGVPGDIIGFFRRYHPPGSDEQPPEISDRVLAWLRKTLDEDGDISDTWTRVQRYTVIAGLSIPMQLAIQQSAELAEKYQPFLTAIRRQNRRARILTDLITIDAMSDEERQAEADWLDSFVPEDDPLLDRFTRGRAYLLRAQLAERIGGVEDPAYEASLHRALKEDSRADNPGLQWLLSFFANRPHRYCDFIATADKFYGARPTPEVAQAVAQIRQITTC